VSTNGNKHTNGNGHGPWRNTLAESANFAGAEMVAIGISLGVIGVADQVAPGILKPTYKMLGKIIEPYLDNVEGGLKKVCKLEECQPDTNQPREKRAEQIARTITLFSAAWVISFAAKLAARRGLNHLAGLGDENPWWHIRKANHEDKKVMWVDEGVHYGSLMLMNLTPTGAKGNDEMLRSTSALLQKIGLSKAKSDELATMAVVWELPNILGMFAGWGAIAHTHLGKKPVSHVEQLAHQTTLSNITQKT